MGSHGSVHSNTSRLLSVYLQAFVLVSTVLVLVFVRSVCMKASVGDTKTKLNISHIVVRLSPATVDLCFVIRERSTPLSKHVTKQGFASDWGQRRRGRFFPLGWLLRRGSSDVTGESTTPPSPF